MKNNLEGFIEAIFANGGASYSLSNGLSTDGNFASYEQNEYVIPADSEREQVNAHLSNFIARNGLTLEDERHYVGGWISNGKLYFDVSRRFDSVEEAAFFGIMNNQLAMFSFKHGEIELPSQQAGTEWQRETYAKMSAGRIAAEKVN
jgi:hypothetical protein